MALRPPSRYSASATGGSGAGLNLLDHEIAAEKASALGRAGERVETCLIRLRESARDPGEHAALLKEAADAVYAYFIQRELCGFRRHHEVIRDYAIPREVLARLGAS